MSCVRMEVREYSSGETTHKEWRVAVRPAICLTLPAADARPELKVPYKHLLDLVCVTEYLKQYSLWTLLMLVIFSQSIITLL